MGFKIGCQVGGGATPFSKIPYVREFSNIWFQKLSFFFLFLIEFSHFFENLKNVIYNVKLKKTKSRSEARKTLKFHLRILRSVLNT